ncbi:uncharacterized protein MELLADRAFT_68477 [Melampsora larici-populina 98AG31]|uniref:Secreted protein n=1 Tax=Melampsora larici-populina (strain 98AG31 / pathotype 3-4-7) TaxID=747676 RepID=F4S6Y3_MELLP|nr:uncharacterized protein MELLADRAFT_68477 [Melampsora larici-populina 98AG31]EGF99537.1 hypothetical protein MELLADRAFT_68477 [Melampsora larici-populina 98AG31]
MASQSLSWAVFPLAFYSTLISCVLICMVQAGPMQDGFHMSAGLAHDLGHDTGAEHSAVSYTEYHPSGNYFQVTKTRLPTPAGFLHYPITLPYFWEARDAQVWGSAFQKNAESGLSPSNWIPPVHPQYDSTPYPVSAAQPQHGPYPVAQNMQPPEFSNIDEFPHGTLISEWPNPIFSSRIQQVGPIKQQLGATWNQRKLPEANFNPQINQGSTKHPVEKDSKGKAASSDSTVDGASSSMGANQPSTVGPANRVEKTIRPNFEPGFRVGDFRTLCVYEESELISEVKSSIFRPSDSPPTPKDIQVIPSFPLRPASEHSIAPFSLKESSNAQQIKTFKEISGESPAPESRDKLVVYVHSLLPKSQTLCTRVPTLKGFSCVLISSSSDASENRNRPSEGASTSSSSGNSNEVPEKTKDQEWQVYSKKNRKFGKPLQPTRGNPPKSSGQEKLLLDKARLTKAQDFKSTRKGELENTEVEDEAPEDQNTPISRLDLDTEGQNFGKIGESNKKNQKKKKKKGAKSSKDDQVDDDVLKTAAYIAPDAKSKIRKIIWDMDFSIHHSNVYSSPSHTFSDDLVQGDNPKPLLAVHLDRPRYNEIFTLDSQYDHLRGNVIDQLMSQYLEELISKVSYQEANRRFFALQNQVIEDNRLKTWQLHRHILDEPIKDIIRMLKVDEMWPVFYDAKPDDWKVVEDKISSLNLRSKNLLELAMPQDARAKRIATMYAAGEANRHQNRMMYSEEELKAWVRQGVSAALLIRVGDILDLTSPKLNWENLSEAQLGWKARDFFNCLKGGIVVDGRAIYREPVHWYTSGARMLILEDKKFRGTFENRLKRLVEFGQDRATIYDKSLETEDQTSINQMNKKKGAELVKEVDKEKGKVPPSENDEIVTLSEYMIGTHFGILAKRLIEFKRKIKFKNLMLESQTKRMGSRISHPKAGVTWPKSVSPELAPLKSQFRDFYKYFGTAFNE